jgi:hypothetical protein
VTAELLFQHGFKSADEVAQADEAALAEVDGIVGDKIATILASAREHVERLKQEAEAAAIRQKEEAEREAMAAVSAAVTGERESEAS